MKLTPRLAAQHLLRKHSMPLCIVLCGLPGSGKSTFVKTLKSEMPDDELVVIDTDSFIEAAAAQAGISYSEAFQRISFKDAKRHMNETLATALSKGQNVILDQTNVSAKSRTGKMASVPGHYTKVCVVVDVDEKVLWERLRARVGKQIPRSVVETMAKSWIPPSRTEGYAEVITVDNN